ncbi:MAG TPA: hypothetical protein ENK13_01950, partial [Thermopetrobacter sp.]|nr:hypothetical protein [Thermopetrobacter sp.]
APAGVNRGEVCHLDRMLPEYYRLRGWDEAGRPAPALLARLGLDDLAALLGAAGINPGDA